MAVAATPPLRPVGVRVLPGVWRPHYDASLLAAKMAELGLARGADVLDVFTGSGALAVSAACCGARSVTAVDISRRALLTAWLNARRNGVAVRVVRGDLFSAVPGRRFDLVLANPPYVIAGPELPRRGLARAWAGGADGRALVDRLCDDVAGALTAGGTVLLVQSSLTGELATLERLRASGIEPRVLHRHPGPLGPMARRELERRGLPVPASEETLVIAGRLG